MASMTERPAGLAPFCDMATTTWSRGEVLELKKTPCSTGWSGEFNSRLFAQFASQRRFGRFPDLYVSRRGGAPGEFLRLAPCSAARLNDKHKYAFHPWCGSQLGRRLLEVRP